MTPLDASFQSSGRSANLVEPSDVVDIVFTAPPAQANNVTVQLIETAGTGDVVRTDRLIATFRGQISGSKFKLDGPSNDPLDPNPNRPNPEIASFSRTPDAPVFHVKFKDDPTESKVPLPDVEDENGAYELKLKIDGTVSGATVTFTGTAILNLRVRQDVMIVPDTAAATEAQKKSSEFSLFDQNARFAAQWRKFAGARRKLVTMPIDGSLRDFESAVTSAAAKAPSGDVILFVGHGGAGGFRGLSISIFDTTPVSTHGVSHHTTAITSDVMNLPNIATKDASGKWIANDKVATDAQTKVDSLALRFDTLTRLGNVLKQNKVARFIVLSCNMGKDVGFGFKVAKQLQTTVGGYPQLIATNDMVFTDPGQPTVTLVQAWMMSTDDPPANPLQDPNHPDTKDRNHSSFHEIPGGMKEFKSP